MPANPNSPFGFRFVKMIEPGSPNYGTRVGMIASGNTHQIFTGDVLAVPSSGYYDVATVTSGGAAGGYGGIASSFEWVSLSQGRTVRQNWWPGNGDANGDVTVYFYAHPQAVYEVQCLSGPLTQADVGKGINFAVGSGGRTFGAGNQSSFTVDDGTKNATLGNLPFRILELPVFGPLASQYATAGYDATQQFNRVWVTMINMTPG